jgi:hypothetical protein
MTIYLNNIMVFNITPNVSSLMQQLIFQTTFSAQQGDNNISFIQSGLNDSWGFMIGNVKAQRIL